ncbi:hypothetical protein WH95_13975 [Kiloniella litopenaei]|uniref:Uncharacterized protein n=1 Tax=Kiloniella litopenaei TaxID=1549748 RepID=A0A0M2R369_9PROT|nr:hypothetical protein [Kiloniella litopenaei]KKJ76317.1 hypothetical protein WH95_13975 [Kiloniella litopenaei]
MKAIKIAVAIMTVLLVVGFAVVIYTISTRLSDGTLSKKKEEVEILSDDSAAGTLLDKSGKPFDTVSIKVPAGCRLADTQLLEGRVLFRFDGELGRNCQRVELYNARNGTKIGGWQIDISAD